jgi:hypothetical protein
MSEFIEGIGKSIAESMAPKAAEAEAVVPRPDLAPPGVVTPPLSQRFSVLEAPSFPDAATITDPQTLLLNAEMARATQDLQDQLRASTDAQAMHRMSQGFVAAKSAMSAALQPMPVPGGTPEQAAVPQAITPADQGAAVLTQLQTLARTASADHERIAHVMGFDHRPLLFDAPATPESAMLLRLAPWANGVALEAQRAGIDIDKALEGAPVGDGTQQTTAPVAILRTRMLAEKVSAADPSAAVGPPKDLIDIPPELQKSPTVAFPPARPIVLPGPGETTAEHAPTPEELQSGGPRANIQQQNVLAQLSGWQGVPDAAHIQFGKPELLRLTDAKEIPIDIDKEGRLIAHVPSPTHMNETVPIELVGGDLGRAGLSPGLEPVLTPAAHSPVVLAYDPATNRAYVDKEWTHTREWLQDLYNRSDRADIGTAETNPITAILTTLQLPNPSPDFVDLLDRQIAAQVQRVPGLLGEAKRDAGPGAQDWEIEREYTKRLREHSLVTAGLEAAKAITMRRVQLALGEPDPVYNPVAEPEPPTKELRNEPGAFSRTEVRPDFVAPWNRLKPYEGTDDLPLVEVAKRLLHPDPIDIATNPKGAMRRLVRVLTDEVAARLTKDQSGADWYRGQLATMDSVLRTHLFPAASEIEHALFRVPLALTSVGQTVPMNFELAIHSLERYLESGKWPVTGPHRDRWPGLRGRTIMWLMERLNYLHHEHFNGSGEDLIAFLLQQHTTADLRALADTLRKSTASKVGPSIDGQPTDLNYGARIFGPKVGNFILNMYGVADAVTVDAWATRSMRRILGIAKQDWDSVGERMTLDDGLGAKDRRILQQAMTIAAKVNGVSPMDAQALLWGHEKELWAYSGTQAESAEGFGDVAQRFVDHTPEERTAQLAEPVLRESGGYIPWAPDAPNPGRPGGSERLRELAGVYRKLAGLEIPGEGKKLTPEQIDQYAKSIKISPTGKGFEQQGFPVTIQVKVTFSDGTTHFDAVKGLNAGQALARAGSNWPAAQSIEIVSEPIPDVVPNVQIDVQVGMAYDAMPHNPSDPETAAAYAAFKAETLRQYAVLVSSGYTFEFATPDTEYRSSEEAHADMVGNKRIKIFPSLPQAGFGAAGMQAPPADYPMIEPVPNTQFTYNDIFRGVHDLFGHGMAGHDFSHAGEISAWLEHQQMYSPLAQRALDTETLGQECWFSARPAQLTPEGDYTRGPFDEATQGLPDFISFADQKAGLLPIELMSAVRAYYREGTPTGMLEVPGLTLRDARKRLPTNERAPLSPRADAGLKKLAELGPVKWKGGIGTFAMGINPDALPILRDGMIDIRNKVIRNPRDLAQVMQAFRHTYEIHHLVAVGESGKIHAHYAATSKLPDHTIITPQDHGTLFDFLLHWLQRVQGAAGEPIKFYSVHNHPSGEVVPSQDADVPLMNWLVAKFPRHFAGGLIINSNKYTQMMPQRTTKDVVPGVTSTEFSVKSTEWTLDNRAMRPGAFADLLTGRASLSESLGPQDEILTPSLEHDVLDMGKLETSGAVARAFSSIAHEPNDYVTVLGVTARSEPRCGFYVPKNFMLDPAFEGWLANRMKETGTSIVFLRIPEVSFDHPLAQKAFELQRNGPVCDTQVGGMDSGYNPHAFLRSVQASTKIGLQLDTHGEPAVLRSPQVPYQPSLNRAAALAHLASGQSFSAKPELFEALTDDEKFHAIQVRLAEGAISRSPKHILNLNPQKWSNYAYPKYFKTWRPTADQLTQLQQIYDRRITGLNATWDLQDKLADQVAAKQKAGTPVDRKPTKQETVPLERFLQMDPAALEAMLKEDPSTYSELVRQFFSSYSSMEDELNTAGEPTERETNLSKLELMRDVFHDGAMELKDSGPHPAGVPRSPLSGLQRRLLSTKQNTSALRTLVRLMGRPQGVMGVRKQLPHPIERIAAGKSGDLDQSFFSPTYDGAMRSHVEFNQTARDFMPLADACSKSEDLDRAVFTALELRLDDRELARPEWNGFRVRRPGQLLPSTINLSEWVPKLRAKYDDLISKVEQSKIKQARMKVAQHRYDALVIEAELRRRELEAAQEDDPTVTDWDQVPPEKQSALRKALKAEDKGDSTSTDFAYQHGGLQGYSGPAPTNIGARSYESLATRRRLATKRLEDAQADIEAIQGGVLRRDGYVTHSYRLMRDAVRNDLRDPYSLSYRYVSPAVRNHYLDERKSEKEPFKSWAVNWFLYLHKMHETAYLEPELKRAAQQLLKVPDDQRVSMQHWLLRLQDQDFPIDRILNRVQYNALMEEPGLFGDVYKAFTKRPFKDLVREAKDTGELSHRGWSNVSESARSLMMTALVSPVRVAGLHATSASFMLNELAKRPHVDLPMGVIWGATGALQAGLEGAGEFLSWLGSHTGLMERYYSRPSQLGVSASLDDIYEHRQQLMRGRYQSGTDRMSQALLKYRGMVIRVPDFLNRALLFHVKEKQYLFYGADPEFAAREAAKDTLDTWGTYGKRDTSPVAASQLWKHWWSLKRYTAARSGMLATNIIGASEALRRGLGAISPERFGVVQPSADAGDQGMLPPPPPPPPAHSDSTVGDVTDPDEQQEMDWLLKSPAPYGAAFPAGPDASLRHLFSVMLGLPATIVSLYLIGSMVTEEYRKISALRIWDNVDPWKWSNLSEIPAFFWNQDFSLILRYSAYGELFGRTAQEQKEMERSEMNLLYKFPILGAIMFERDMDAKEAQRESKAPMPPSAGHLPSVPGTIRGRQTVKQGILQRVTGWLHKQQSPAKGAKK